MRLAAGRLDLAHDGVGFRLVGARIHHHRRAGGGQLARDGAADIASGAGDDGDFAGEFVAFSLSAAHEHIQIYPRNGAKIDFSHHTASPAA